VKVAVVFDPSPEIGPDPDDPHKRDRRLGEFWDSDKLDMLLVVRQYGDEFEGGSETQVFASGIWENIDLERVEEAIDHLGEL